MTPTRPKPLSRKAFGRDYLDRETISLFVESDNLRSNPFAARKRYDSEGAHICFIEPFGSKVSLGLIEREVASREFLAQHLRGFRCEAGFRSKP